MRRVSGDVFSKDPDDFSKDPDEVAILVIEDNRSYIDIMSKEEYVEYTKKMAVETIMAQPFY